MQQQQRYLRRIEIRSVDCPECGARAGEKCRWARGKVREASHLPRQLIAVRKFTEEARS